MATDPEKMKQFLRSLISTLKTLETEAAAYRLTFEMVKRTNLISDLDETLQAGKLAAEAAMNAKYDALLESYLKEIEKRISDDWFVRLLEQAKPTGPTN